MKGKKLVRTIVCVLLVCGTALGIAGYGFIQKYYGNSHYVRDEDVKLNSEAITEPSSEQITKSSFDYSRVKKVSQAKVSGTYSILLIGSDTREGDDYGNSDAMILLTINHNVHKIFLVSFMRDLYAEIPDVGVRKLNAAFAIGGGPLLVKTIESNYGVEIDNYAAVTFDGMAKIIDLAGGVDIDLDNDERLTANNYITSMFTEGEIKGDMDSEYIQDTGNVHLDGVQAVGYARIRYIGNADYERTSRQRKVLSKVMENFKKQNLSNAADLVDEISPYITHNLSQARIMYLLAQLPTITGYELVTDRIPFDGMFKEENEILVPDMEPTIEKLQNEIYKGEKVVDKRENMSYHN